jgi:neopullulanase
MVVYTPDWVKHAIFYQIFPDRFARSSRLTHPAGIEFKPWGSPPEEQGFQGGDLFGIVEKLDYLGELGITALYLNPIFASASNHRYHTYDYYQVDPLLGGNAALRELLDAAHAQGIRVVLDGVFNHASRGFWAFHHILENGPTSPYLDWFLIHGWPLRPYPSGSRRPPNYECWWNLPALPKFNTNNPGVRDYIMDVARYWIDFGIDGWRLDVPFEIDDDSFWQRFREVVKTANPEAYICGEIWRLAQRWLQGDQFDAVMNYPFARAVLCFFGAATLRQDYSAGEAVYEPLGVPEFAELVEQMQTCYHWDINCAQFNLLDSHDTARALWVLGGDKRALCQSVLFLMTMPGAPCVYYGDEIGMSSAGDPYCRAAFPWHDKSQWDHELLAFYRRAITLRHQHSSLRRGDYHTLPLPEESGLFAFSRVLDKEIAVVLFNRNDRPVTLDLLVPEPALENQVLTDSWNEGNYTVTDGKLRAITVPARDARVLFTTREPM